MQEVGVTVHRLSQADAPQGCGAPIAAGGIADGPVVGQPLAHIVQQQVRVGPDQLKAMCLVGGVAPGDVFWPVAGDAARFIEDFLATQNLTIVNIPAGRYGKISGIMDHQRQHRIRRLGRGRVLFNSGRHGQAIGLIFGAVAPGVWHQRRRDADVADEAAVAALVTDTVAYHGGIDLFVSNAGYVTVGGLEAPDDELRRMFDVHVMAHVYAARHVIPHMVDQGGGYLLNTSSAAGLLTQIGSLHYSVTKRAAVALAEWIRITYGDRGIGVSVLCPQAVETNIKANSPTVDLLPGDEAGSAAAVDGVLTAEELAGDVIEALAAERFHVLPHPDVAEYVRRKGDDVDRWLGGMQRFQSRLFPDGPTPADWLLG